jgi:hypothetical protein
MADLHAIPLVRCNPAEEDTVIGLLDSFAQGRLSCLALPHIGG